MSGNLAHVPGEISRALKAKFQLNEDLLSWNFMGIPNTHFQFTPVSGDGAVAFESPERENSDGDARLKEGCASSCRCLPRVFVSLLCGLWL